MAIRRYTIGNNLAYGGEIIGSLPISNVADGTPLKAELEINNLGPDSTQLTGRVYNVLS
jgi:hypothetical protein